ncbi:helix-turn-helix domain-containing protein [Streptomyces scopuliridis]|uniref:Helix-turn-helix domain-containing protein n=1 Tax=Streptomyces scopuliridis TaxID=452529 RepID=A0ACD4ZIF3_9ACTN|nr:helix-turn-helix transcriptional regulator [Streptomyces scopuliridis]WSB33328.1 helix-turn-helix domain-containing protein [Streptomyces scopuliridis]WSB97596.1 helix-turn-helix domain-containing protein [Streptomyces scopuliridis]WSC08701.1 helix-turn-helix domain-containing protein [Streptomyces scopuliridis]
MMTDTQAATPTLCRLQLGSELRQLRLNRALTSTQVVRKLLWSPSKLTRLETGENATVEPAEVMALCQIYGVDEETAARLQEYAAVTKTKREWWQATGFRPLLGPGHRAFLGIEASALVVHTYQTEYVPGLLQTADYARVLHRHANDGRPDEEIDSMVELRMTRQRVLVRKPPLKYAAIFSESVLRRQVGGPTVLKAQLARIIEAASAPNVTVQVLPFKMGVHRGMNGAFTTFRFRDDFALKPMVHLEHLADHWLLRRKADVQLYEDTFNDLQTLAPGSQESLSLIKEAMEEL